MAACPVTLLHQCKTPTQCRVQVETALHHSMNEPRWYPVHLLQPQSTPPGGSPTHGRMCIHQASPISTYSWWGKLAALWATLWPFLYRIESHEVCERNTAYLQHMFYLLSQKCSVSLRSPCLQHVRNIHWYQTQMASQSWGGWLLIKKRSLSSCDNCCLSVCFSAR